jgi:dTDP-4-dehydrorhamnose 3,5-epimerase-like enzyme
VKLRLKKFNIYQDKTGNLVPFYTKKNFDNFKIKRFFFLYGKKSQTRAKHAHKKCNQILIPVRGTSKIKIINKKKKIFKFMLKPSFKKYLFVPKFHWIEIKFSNNNDSLLTLCDYEYDKKEYINSLNKLYES